MINDNVSVKSIAREKKDYHWHPSKRICNNNRYLKMNVNDSVIACDKIISANHKIKIMNHSVSGNMKIL